MKISKANTSVGSSTNCEEAKKHIKAAIDCLGRDAKDNIVAKESIANLSVVLLDLQ
nr:MAG TPA: putative glycogen [Caudoviricetes sp.]